MPFSGEIHGTVGVDTSEVKARIPRILGIRTCAISDMMDSEKTTAICGILCGVRYGSDDDRFGIECFRDCGRQASWANVVGDG